MLGTHTVRRVGLVDGRIVVMLHHKPSATVTFRSLREIAASRPSSASTPGLRVLDDAEREALLAGEFTSAQLCALVAADQREQLSLFAVQAPA